MLYFINVYNNLDREQRNGGWQSGKETRRNVGPGECGYPTKTVERVELAMGVEPCIGTENGIAHVMRGPSEAMPMKIAQVPVRLTESLLLVIRAQATSVAYQSWKLSSRSI